MLALGVGLWLLLALPLAYVVGRRLEVMGQWYRGDPDRDNEQGNERAASSSHGDGPTPQKERIFSDG